MESKYFKRASAGVYECHWLDSEHTPPEYFDPPSIVRLTHAKLTRLFSVYIRVTRAIEQGLSDTWLTDGEREETMASQARVIAMRSALMRHLGFPEDPELFLDALKQHAELKLVKDYLSEIDRDIEISSRIEKKIRVRGAESHPLLNAKSMYSILVFIEVMEVRDSKGDVVSKLSPAMIENDPWFFDQQPLIQECFQMIVDDHLVHLGSDLKKFQETLDRVVSKSQAILAQTESLNETSKTRELQDSQSQNNSSSSQDLRAQALEVFQKTTPLEKLSDSTPSTS